MGKEDLVTQRDLDWKEFKRMERDRENFHSILGDNYSGDGDDPYNDDEIDDHH